MTNRPASFLIASCGLVLPQAGLSDGAERAASRRNTLTAQRDLLTAQVEQAQAWFRLYRSLGRVDRRSRSLRTTGASTRNPRPFNFDAAVAGLAIAASVLSLLRGGSTSTSPASAESPTMTVERVVALEQRWPQTLSAVGSIATW